MDVPANELLEDEHVCRTIPYLSILLIEKALTLRSASTTTDNRSALVEPTPEVAVRTPDSLFTVA